jgi:hypothetical protein
VFALLAGVACAPAPRPGSESHLAPRSAASSAAELARLQARPPIYALVYTWTESGERIALAQQRLAKACMARLGFRYDPAAPAKSDAVAEDRPAPFGLESLDPPAADGPGASPSEAPAGTSQAYARALFGDPNRHVTAHGTRLRVSRPANGCLAEAEQRLLGNGRVRWIQLRILLFEMEGQSRQLLEHDPAFRAANSRWQQCMRNAGFDWPGPRQLLHSLPARTDIRTNPTTRADVQCKAKTGYLTTAYARLADVQRKRLAGDPTVLADWTSLLHRQDSAARAVLAAG